MDQYDAIYDILDNRVEIAQVLANVTTEIGERKADELVDGEDVESAAFKYVAPVDSHATVLSELVVDYLHTVDEKEINVKSDATAPSSSSTSSHHPSVTSTVGIIETTRQLIERLVEAGRSAVKEVEHQSDQNALEPETPEEEESAYQPPEQRLRDRRYLVHLGIAIFSLNLINQIKRFYFECVSCYAVFAPIRHSCDTSRQSYLSHDCLSRGGYRETQDFLFSLLHKWIQF